MGLLIVVFGFFFVTVSSRIVGIIGTSSNPISGMTIATLMATCLVFVALGRTGDVYQSMALCVGAIVCIAAANAGATSQDLKTGLPRRRDAAPAADRPHHRRADVDARHRRHALPARQDVRDPGEAHGIGGPKLAAPQATLMATIIKGLLAQNLPWAPVLVGVFLAFMAQLAGAHALSWAVGAYLPLSTTFPIWIGGMMKALADKITHRKGEESELSSGMLYSPPASSPADRSGASSSRSSRSSATRCSTWRTRRCIEKLDLGQKFYPRHSRTASAATSSARSSSRSCAGCW